MRTFHYFVPDRTTVVAAELAALGLAYAFEPGRGVDCRGCDRGPGGLRGVVIAQSGTYDDGKNGYYPERQVWRQAPGASVWAGHYKDELPSPDDLARAKPLGGELLELNDGSKWLVPVARQYSERDAGDDTEIFWTLKLPQRLDIAADGQWVPAGVNARYTALWELAETWVAIRHGEGTDEQKARFDYSGTIDAALLCLQANYRLGRIEAALSDLFTDELALDCLDVLIDRPNLITLFKKKAENRAALTACESSVSPAGPPAETPITVQPLPI